MYSTYKDLVDSLIDDKRIRLESGGIDLTNDYPLVNRRGQVIKDKIFRDSLKNGNDWEDILEDRILEYGETTGLLIEEDERDRNDDLKFDLQHRTEGVSIRLESKFHDHSIGGNLFIVVYEHGKWKGWLLGGNSDLYVGTYIKQDKIHHSYIKVLTFIDLMRGGKLDKYKKESDNRYGNSYYGYLIPSVDFEDLCDYVDIR